MGAASSGVIICEGKISLNDGHSLCLFCFGEAHRSDSCQHCAKFSRQTCKNRALRLSQHLLESVLSPPTMLDSSSRLPPKSSASGSVLATPKVLSTAAQRASGNAADVVFTDLAPSQSTSSQLTQKPLSTSVQASSSVSKGTSSGTLKTMLKVKKLKPKHKDKPKKHNSNVKSAIVITEEPPARLLASPVENNPLSISFIG